MKALHMVTFTLVIIGALNWGLVGLFKLDVVNALLGATGLETIVHILIGVSAVYLALTHMNECKVCSAKSKS